MATNTVDDSRYMDGVPRSYSMPAFRVVGFHPSMEGLSTLVTKSGVDRGDGVFLSQVSSPLSRMLIAEKNGSLVHRSGGSFSGDSSTSSVGDGMPRRESSTSCSLDADMMSTMMNTIDTISSDNQTTESNLEGFEHVVAPAAPIDIPYNAHGVRHWRRQAQYRQQRRAENWA